MRSGDGATSGRLGRAAGFRASAVRPGVQQPPLACSATWSCATVAIKSLPAARRSEVLSDPVALTALALTRAQWGHFKLTQPRGSTAGWRTGYQPGGRPSDQPRGHRRGERSPDRRADGGCTGRARTPALSKPRSEGLMRVRTEDAMYSYEPTDPITKYEPTLRDWMVTCSGVVSRTIARNLATELSTP